MARKIADDVIAIEEFLNGLVMFKCQRADGTTYTSNVDPITGKIYGTVISEVGNHGSGDGTEDNNFLRVYRLSKKNGKDKVVGFEISFVSETGMFYITMDLPNGKQYSTRLDFNDMLSRLLGEE